MKFFHTIPKNDSICLHYPCGSIIFHKGRKCSQNPLIHDKANPKIVFFVSYNFQISFVMSQQNLLFCQESLSVEQIFVLFEQKTKSKRNSFFCNKSKNKQRGRKEENMLNLMRSDDDVLRIMTREAEIEKLVQ